MPPESKPSASAFPCNLGFLVELSYWLNRTVKAGVLLLFLMVAPGCVPEQQEPTRDDAAADTLHFLNVSNEVAFVGDEACASCHEDLYQSYQTHGMAQSFAPVTEDKVPAVVADMVRYHAATDFYYRVFQAEGRFFQEEYRLGPSGEQTHRLVREMLYVTGSGKAGYTYFTEQNDRYYQLPLSWYVHPSTWDFNPGYAESNKRFDRALNNAWIVASDTVISSPASPRRAPAPVPMKPPWCLVTMM